MGGEDKRITQKLKNQLSGVYSPEAGNKTDKLFSAYTAVHTPTHVHSKFNNEHRNIEISLTHWFQWLYTQ